MLLSNNPEGIEVMPEHLAKSAVKFVILFAPVIEPLGMLARIVALVKSKSLKSQLPPLSYACYCTL